MAKTQLDTKQVQSWLKLLGYYAGPIHGNYQDANYRIDLRRFQSDYSSVTGTPDGWYGPKTEAALLSLIDKFKSANHVASIKEMRRWRLTYYYIGEQARWSGPQTIPFYAADGSVIATVEADCYVEAALEGTTRLRDGRLVNVASGDHKKVDADKWTAVYAIVARNDWIDRPGYAGVSLSKDKSKIVGARRFASEKPRPGGYPLERGGIELQPFRTLATDTGTMQRHDPTWMGKGGVVPFGTRVFILEFLGVKLPDGTTHDGWFLACDTGGIFGAHADVFTGSKTLASKVHIPERAHVWFAGIEHRLPMDYGYGL